jgi:hypothetical protein
MWFYLAESRIGHLLLLRGLVVEVPPKKKNASLKSLVSQDTGCGYYVRCSRSLTDELMKFVEKYNV